MKKKALVAGAGGFIGSHLVKRLKGEGFWVRGVDLKYPEFAETYADDFVITGKSKELLVDKIKPAVVAFLQERGLSLSEEKTRITRIEDGFDFLGQNLRKYAGKLLVKPARDAVKSFLRSVRDTIRKFRSAKTVDLIRVLNAKIRGWANYHRHVVSCETFRYVEDCLHHSLWRWARS